MSWINSQTASYTIGPQDNGKLIVFNSASAVTATLPQPGENAGFGGTFTCGLANIGSGAVTVSPTSATIDRESSITLDEFEGIQLWTDGTNYFSVRGLGSGGGGGTDATSIQGTPVSSTIPTDGQILTFDGTDWIPETPGSGGTVTSVGIAVPSRQSVSGSPVTASGTITISDNNQSANEVFAGPSSGSAAAPGFRALVPADLPVATDSALGAVQPDGSTITVSSGVISAVASGGNSPLYGIGGFGSNSLGTLVATYSQNGTISWGPFSTLDIDSAHLVTTVAGHVYRAVWYFVGTSSGSNLCLVEAGTSGSTSKGYFFGEAFTAYVNGASYTNTDATILGTGVVQDAAAQIAETYLWVRGASNNRIWARGFGAEWFGVDDAHADFTGSQLELGFTGGTLTAAYVYDLGAVPTS